MQKLTIFIAIALFAGTGCASTTLNNQTNTTTTPTTVLDTAIRSHEKEIVSAAKIEAKKDLENNSAAQNGLEVDYGDVTHNDREAALVLIPSGGTAGVTAVLVYDYQNNKPHLLQRIDGYKMTARAIGGDLVIDEYDPTKQTLDTMTDETYVWNGSTAFDLKDSRDINVGGE